MGAKKQIGGLGGLSFEYCALRYLMQWEQKERGICERFCANPTSRTTREAMAYFQVSRSFPGLGGEGVAASIVGMIREVEGNLTLSPSARVGALAEKFRNAFGKMNVSASSKLLWLRHKSPYVIFDSRAANSLKSLGCSFADSDYMRYCELWQEQYQQHASAIKGATLRLREAEPFFSHWYGSKNKLLSVVRNEWFMERVFDMYLWEAGGMPCAPSGHHVKA